MPDEHDDVRAWLASDPAPKMPDDIAARVHAAIERESQARDEVPVAASAPASVTPLRRPGRWKAPLLAAAGVVAVVAIAVPVVNEVSDSSNGDAASDDGGVSAVEGTGGMSGDSAAPQSKDSAKDNGITGSEGAPLELHRDSFAADVRAYVGLGDVDAYRSSPRAASSIRCVDGVPTSPHGIDATLDGDPAQLLANPVDDGRTKVRAVVCGPDGPEVVARATVR